jgi:hypothetical protein
MMNGSKRVVAAHLEEDVRQSEETGLKVNTRDRERVWNGIFLLRLYCGRGQWAFDFLFGFYLAELHLLLRPLPVPPCPLPCLLFSAVVTLEHR